ncbi:MAG: hypothetical protein AAGH74_08515 [Pseudomonadota bacterium]
MIWRWAMLFLAGTAAADEVTVPPLLCGGVEPSWTMTIEEKRGSYATPDRPDPVLYDIPLITKAEGRPWPRVVTLIGRGDTALAILDERQCTDTMSDLTYPFEATLLTQRGSEAIALTGCCRLKPDG